MKFQRKRERKPKLYRKCPRCGNKCLASQARCEECDLLFSRLEYTSNKAAKKKLRRFDRDFIIYTNQLPKDVSRVKLILFSIFFGIFGGHYYYVGKYVKALLMTAVFILLILCTIFNTALSEAMDTYYLYFPIGVAGFAWIVSITLVLCKRFKVPVIVDIPESVEQDMKKQREDFDRMKNDLEKENKKLAKLQKDEEKEEAVSVQGKPTVEENKAKNADEISNKKDAKKGGKKGGKKGANGSKKKQNNQDDIENLSGKDER